MAAVIKQIMRNYYRLLYLESDQRTIDWPLMSSPLPVIAIVAIYIPLVTKWGPAYMKHRKPFNLDKLMQVYNIFQVLACSTLVIMGVIYGYGPSGHLKFWCAPVDYTVNDFTDKVIMASYSYFLLKIADLLDTIFFVLRKNTRQVTFLHLYHHTAMVLGTWLAMRFIAGGSSIFIGWLNSLVHAIMYTYYFLTSWDPTLKSNVWWKKYITQIQIMQFATFCIYIGQLLLFQSCGYPKFLFAVLLFPQNFFMLFMFLDFYKRAYHSSRST